MSTPVQGAVPIHPEAVAGDPSQLRWVVPAGTLPFVGAVSACPTELRGWVDDGTIAEVTVETTAVRIRLAPGRSWRDEGERIRTGLQGALLSPDAWSTTVAASPDTILRAAVTEVLDGDVGDYIRSHGGAVRLVDVTDGRVELSLDGACAHCPSSDATLTDRIETAVRGRYPALREVVAHGDTVASGGRRLLGLFPVRRTAAG
ncbi:MAG: NifU family protein [Rhodococcus sp. (in: high G+C Gram-positive bacteria)]